MEPTVGIASVQQPPLLRIPLHIYWTKSLSRIGTPVTKARSPNGGMSGLLWILATVSLNLAFCLSLQAQQSLATVRGTALGLAGVLASNVAITVTDVATGGTRSAVTNADGNYEIPDLPPGTYRPTPTLSRFSTTYVK